MHEQPWPYGNSGTVRTQQTTEWNECDSNWATGYLLLGLISTFVFRAVRDTLPNNPTAQERILGASFQLATIHYPSRQTYGGALICEAVGISPLTVLNLGLMRRM